MKILLTSILTVLIAISAFGETPADSVKVYFLAGHWLFDPLLGNNRAAMDVFVEKIRAAKSQDNIERLTVSGFASPEGSNSANQRLSRQRCEEIANYIAKHTEIDSSLIQTYADGVAWVELRVLVSQNPDVPSRERVLDILDNTPLWIYDSQGKITDGRKKQLMELAGGSVWNWMMRNLFPELRNAVAVMLYLKHKAETQALPEPVISTEEILIAETSIIEEVVKPDQTEIVDIENVNDVNDLNDCTDITDITDFIEPTDISDPTTDNIEPTTDISDPTTDNIEPTTDIKESKAVAIPAKAKPYYMAMKTNMLYDAAIVPNFGAEFYLGKNISIYGEWMYAWWKNNARHRYWQIYGGDLGLRWWFGKKAYSKPLTGHHLGIYGGIHIFDFEMGETGYMGGKPGGTLWDRFIIDSGIEYGYSLPIAKRLNIDFSIGLGYLGGNYIKYYPFDNDYYRQKEYKMRYFGPSKAEISLVWLIGHGNTNRRKGGDK